MIINEPPLAQLLIDPMRRTILNFLADKPMTETQLAEELGLTSSAVGHHLGILNEAGLVGIVKKEPESHGIIQKFYRASALFFVIDLKKMSKNIARYFLPISIERIRGVVSALEVLNGERIHVSADMMRDLAEQFADALVEVAAGNPHIKGESEGEAVVLRLYSDALIRLLRNESSQIQPLREPILKLSSRLDKKRMVTKMITTR